VESLNELTNDPCAYMELDLGEPKTNGDASDNQAPVIVHNQSICSLCCLFFFIYNLCCL
jgi:hypothetical protein